MEPVRAIVGMPVLTSCECLLRGAIPMVVLEDGLAQSASTVSLILYALIFGYLVALSANRTRRWRWSI